MDPAKDEEEECQSSSESGWTMYLGSPGIDQSHTQDVVVDDDDDDDGYHHVHDGGDDDSVASDASSGPSNHHPWMKGGEERTPNHGSKHVHGGEEKKARAHSEQHVMVKKNEVLGDGRGRKKKQQQPHKASSYAR